MATPFNFTSAKDVIKRPQWYNEGDIIGTPANYGATVSNPDFTEAGKNAYLRINRTPQGQATKQAGQEDLDANTLIKKNFDAVLVTNIVDSTLLQWAINSLGTGVGSIQSKTFLQSKYLNSSESFDILKGCLPESCTLRIPRDGLMEMEIGMSVKSISNASSFSIGTGSYGSALAGAPWKADDGGTNPFTYHGTTVLERGITVNVTRTLGAIDSSGDLADIYKKPTERSVSFDVEVFKANNTLQDDVDSYVFRSAASRVLKSAVSTITFTSVQAQSDTLELNPTLRGALTIPYTILCKNVVVT